MKVGDESLYLIPIVRYDSDGQLVYVSVKGEHIWGVNANGTIYRRVNDVWYHHDVHQFDQSPQMSYPHIVR